MSWAQLATVLILSSAFGLVLVGTTIADALRWARFHADAADTPREQPRRLRALR